MKYLVISLVAVMALVGYGIAKRNSFIQQERGIEAAYDANKAVRDQVIQTIEGSGLAADKYGDLVLKAITAAMEGRYGKTGSQAAMQWIQENQPNIDSGIFLKLQQVIETHFAKWSAAQITLRDRVRVYETDTELLPGSLVAAVLGYPRATFDMAKYKTMIVTPGTSQEFDTGKARDIREMLKPR